MIRQKARVEGSICEAYLIREVSTFCSLYFENEVETRSSQPRRNDDGGVQDGEGLLSIFKYPGRAGTIIRKRFFMDDSEYRAAHVYVLCNTDEIGPFLQGFHEYLDYLYPNIAEEQRSSEVSKSFDIWLKKQVVDNLSTIGTRFHAMGYGLSTEIRKYKSYFVNGYLFDTKQGRGRTTYNSGVCVKGSLYGDANDHDYYGVVEEIWELSYLNNIVVLFKCFWFDTTNSMDVHSKTGIVQVKHKSRMSKEDPFILAAQAQQVYYLPYVSEAREHKQWWVPIKTKARSRVDWSHDLVVEEGEDGVFQEVDPSQTIQVLHTNELDDPSNIIEHGVFVELVDDGDDTFIDDTDEVNDDEEEAEEDNY